MEILFIYKKILLLQVMYDLIVIGSGPGGYVAAIRASQLGLKTAIVERAELGGVCLNWGCIPTKALLKSAQVYDYFSHAKDYGIIATNYTADFDAMIQRSRETANSMSKGIQFLLRKNSIEHITGTAKLTAGKRVEVTLADGSKTLFDAKNILLATGARARELPNLKIDGKKIISYRQAMTLKEQPKSMIIVGSGAIGVEFAYFYQTLGTKVTLVEFMPNLVPLEDEDISKQLAKSFKKSGIGIMLNSTVESVEIDTHLCKVKIKTPSGEEYKEAEVVLSAVGITPNTENIGLDLLNIQNEKGKVLVDDYFQTNVKGIYAIGDIIPGPALAHVASAEGIICVENIAGLNPQPMNFQNIPGCTYCQPEIASVGLTEKAAREKGYDLKIGKFPFTASGKATASGTKDGFIKVIFDAKYGEWLGAHMIGANVTEMIAEVVVARNLETTGHQIIKSVHPHPTMSEAIMEAVANAYGVAVHL